MRLVGQNEAAAIFLAGNVFYFGMFWAIGVLVARAYGPAGLGYYGIAQAFSAPVFAFFNLGMRDLSATDVDKKFSASVYFRIRFLGIWLSIMASLGIGWWVSGDTKILLILAGLTVLRIGDALCDIAYGVFQRNGQIGNIVRSQIFRGAGGVLVFGSAIEFGFPLGSSLALTGVFGVIVYLLHDRRALSNERCSRAAGNRQLLRAGVMLSLVMLAALLFQHIVRLYLYKSEVGAENIGFFVGVLHIVGLLTIAVNSLGRSIVGPLSRAHLDEDFSMARDIVFAVAAKATAAGICVFLVAYFFGGIILTLLYGEGFIGAQHWLVLASVWATVNAVKIPLGTAMTVVGNYKEQVLISALALVTLVIGLIVFSTASISSVLFTMILAEVVQTSLLANRLAHRLTKCASNVRAL